jgi:lipopolysaccharide heptosyltransferase III
VESNVETNRQESILIFRLGSIGDTVVALPCFHAIARRFPNHRRVLLTNSLTSARASSAESVLDGTGLVDEVIYYPVGDFSLGQVMALRREIRRLRPTALIYLAERPRALPVFRDLAFFKAAGIAKVIGAPWRERLRMCAIDPATLELEYEVHRLARVLEPTISVSLAASNWDLRLSTDEHTRAGSALAPLDASRSLIAFAPGAKIAAKDWGSANWADLLKALASICDKIAPVMVGARDERRLCEGIAKHWPGPVLNLCGQLTPRETAAVLSRCAMLVCHDSGPMHLAASQGTRCIALFGNYNQPRKWYPYGEGHVVIRDSRGVREIPVDQVAEAMRRALGTAAIPFQRRVAAS